MTHVLVVRLDNDGDVLLAGPAVRALAAGADRVTMWCGPRGRAAVDLLPGVDDVMVWRAPWIDPEPDPVEPEAVEELIERLRRLAADRAIILGSWHQSPLPTALVLRLAEVRFVAATSVDYPGSLLDVRHRIDDDVHEVERSLDLVQTLGYRLPPADDRRLRILRPAAGRPNPAFAGDYVVVHPGASVPERAWDPERGAQLVARLAAESRRVVVTGGPAERELTARVAGPPHPAVLDLGGQTSFAELAEVIAAADAIVVGNTGPAHLAAAVGTPVVSLYAPTVPAVRWRPWHVAHELIYIDVPVSPADVARAVERLAGPVPMEAVA